jgi:DNA repair protein RecN (Recombination protein N)
VLRELRIENLLLIERAELRLGEGLNAITGETGAGKTVLAHSLDLLMGGRARPQIVRPGAKEAWVEGTFDLPQEIRDDAELEDLAARLPDGCDEIVLGRRVSSSGRTAAFVGGRAAAAGDLQRLGGILLAFYGQHEHRRLALASAQMEVLDGFAGPDHVETWRRYREAHREHGRILRELAELRERHGARERDLDLLRYELSEIEATAPDVAEEAELAAEHGRLSHAERLRLAAAGARAAIAGADDEGGAAAALAAAEAVLADAAGLDPALDALAERVAGLGLELADAGADLRRYSEGFDADPGRLAAIEERLEAITRLKRKHGGSVESVLAHAERCRSEIDRLDNAEERGAALEAALMQAEGRREELGLAMSKGRKAASRRLERRVAAELEKLAMPGARLEVALEPHPEGFGPQGRELIELRIATNPGIDPAPLRDAASGGELSRVMLALTRLGESAAERTLVFDEIDAGIGGTTARVVGERLRDLAGRRQVICITHLPQVASLAATHFRIEKQLEGGTATAAVARLEDDQVVAEICRMLGAEGSDEAATRHARELLAA